jgi:hypothetical protein
VLSELPLPEPLLVLPPAGLLLALGVAADSLAELFGLPIAAGGVVMALVLCVLNDSSSTRPAAVLTTARMIRRMGVPFVNGQNSKDSW